MRQTRTVREALICVLGLSALVGCAGPMDGSTDPMAAARELAAACARSVCRTEVREYELTAQDGRFELSTDRFPYADNGTISIFPGEAFVVEFVDSGAVNNPRFVRLVERLDPAEAPDQMTTGGARPTMAFEFTQEPGRPTMTLEIRSTLDVFVKYDATMWVPTPSGIRVAHTSSCPVVARGGGFETWPHPIAMLVLSNFRVQSLEGGFACQ